MAKLSDLKSLLAMTRKDGARSPSSQPESPVSPPAPKPEGIEAATADPATVDSAAIDAASLRQLFADVAPLPPVNRARLTKPRPSAQALQRMRDEANALLESKHGDNPSPSSWEVGQEVEAQQTFLRPGIGIDVLSKLRRGRWVVQDVLDLHRLTVDQARDALAEFLLSARMRGSRCVLVIHGKGLSSPNREPILKGKVRRWLEHWDDVLAYCEAPQHAGGGGAVLVLLKART